MNEKLSLKALNRSQITEILALIKLLNPNLSDDLLKDRLIKMFDFGHFKCLGLYEGDVLIGLSGLWTSVRLHCGKRLELDNIIINDNLQSKGYGRHFLNLLEQWAKQNDYESLELNTYVQNDRSHKFYFNQGFKILGFNFQKQLKP